MAQLVIKGHQTCSNKVIEILEMLGGKNSIKLIGSAASCGYYIDSNGNIAYHYYSSSYFKDAIQFTIEEFLEQYPYKIGDKILKEPYVGARRICEMRWDTDKNCIKYGIGVGEWFNVSQIQPYKEETMEEKNNNWAKWDLPDGYEFQDKDGNIINTSVIRLVKKRPQYPKTYEECCKVLNLTKYPPALVPNKSMYINQYKDFPCYYEIQKLAELIVCRNAYWKIAGDQMGLSKPWKPNWDNNSQFKYLITCWRANIIKETYSAKDCILAFPTKEMRDAFYENFKELIELCKELL